MKNWISKLKGIGLAVLVVMLMTSFAMAEATHLLDGRDVSGRYGQDGKSARVGFINSTCIEGTSDAFETCLYGIDPTADNSLLFPDASGTLATTGGTFSGTLGVNTVGTNQIIDNTVSSADILNSTIVGADISNTGMFNELTIDIATSASSGTATVEAGSIIMGAPIPWANISDIGVDMANRAWVSGTTLTISTNGTVAGLLIQYKVVVLRP